MCSLELTPELQEIFNKVFNNRLEDYTVQKEEINLDGENFLGEIVFLRFENKTDKNKAYFVVKQAPESLKNIENFKSIYTNEIKFYDQIWRVLNKFQQKYFIGFDKIPKCHATYSDKGNEKIVLENLRHQNFLLYNKTIPIDEQHYRLLFENYGVFHAISFAFREENPEMFEELTADLNVFKDASNDANSDNSMDFQNLLKFNLENAMNFFDGEDENIKLALKKHVENPLKYMMEEARYVGETPVLNHGDCWSNNTMFKYNEHKEVIDVRFLDFQMIRAGSPVYDLSYCFYSGAPKSILDQLEVYLKIYHESFTKTLQKLECKPSKPYTFEILKEEWKKYCIMGFYMGLMIWRTKMTDKNHVVKDLTQIKGKPLSEMFIIRQDKVEDFKSLVKGLVVHMYENKFL